MAGWVTAHTWGGVFTVHIHGRLQIGSSIADWQLHCRLVLSSPTPARGETAETDVMVVASPGRIGWYSLHSALTNLRAVPPSVPRAHVGRVHDAGTRGACA